MRGDPQAIVGRLPGIAPAQRWRAWIADVVQERRRTRLERLQIAERRGREERHARARGQYVPEVKYRVRPW